VKRLVVVAFAGLVLIAGCGGSSSETTTTSASTSTVKVYFLRDGKVWPVAREVETGSEPSTEFDNTLAELMEGPTTDERRQLGARTAIPECEAPAFIVYGSDAGISPRCTYSKAALAQVVYTLSELPAVGSVNVDNKRYTRADFEDQTPGILVESPLPFADVSSPLRATGTANTFEATFNYELTDTDGKIVDENFVTATSGTGTRGTFDFTTKKFTVPFEGVGSLVVFERSAEDGSRTKLVEIPLRMSQ
jgi:germination protein M